MKASRSFICVRPQTYESAEEKDVLSYVFAPRGVLANTSFALLDPDGKKITRGSRSPMATFGSVEAFVEALDETARAHGKEAKAIHALPVVRDLRLALNVAAADMRPLIVVRGDDEEQRKALVEAACALAWGEPLVGRAHYVVLSGEQTVAGFTPEPGVTVVQPDAHGQGGKVLGHVPPDQAPGGLDAAITAAREDFEVAARHFREHVRAARRKGIRWETEIPVTDPHARRGR